jgi:CorA-like Mg2+ transporter protein
MTEMPVSLAETPISNGAASGLVWAFRIHADGTPEPLSIDAPIESHHDGWLWLHFNLADARACALLSNLEGLPPEAARLPEGNRQLYVDDSCVYGVFTDLINDVDGVTREFGYLHFAMTERILISARRHAMSAAERARQALAGGRKLTRVARSKKNSGCGMLRTRGKSFPASARRQCICINSCRVCLHSSRGSAEDRIRKRVRIFGSKRAHCSRDSKASPTTSSRCAKGRICCRRK